MLINFLFFILTTLVSLIFAFLPSGDRLPYGLDDTLITAVAYYNQFAESFWFLEIIIQAFVLYLGFLIALVIIKLILGTRADYTQ